MNGKEFTISGVIDSFGLTGHVWLVLILLGIVNMFNGYDFMIVYSTSTYLAASFGFVNNGAIDFLSTNSLMTWSFLGMIIGAAVGGIMSDRIGRKKALVFFLVLYGLFTLLQAFAPTALCVAAWRVLAGLGIGSCISVVTTYLSETVPSRFRALFISMGLAFIALGWLCACVVATCICPQTSSLLGWVSDTQITLASGAVVPENWRLCYLIGAVPIIYGIILGTTLRETPHWYADSGHKSSAVEELQKLESRYKGTVSDYDSTLLIVPPHPAQVDSKSLFSKKYIVATAALWTCSFAALFCVYGMNVQISMWFYDMGYSADSIATLQTVSNLVAIVAIILAGFLADHIGRKKNLLASWILGIVAVILCVIFVKYDPSQANFGLYSVLVALLSFSFSYALGALQPLLPENYPTAIRNMGVSWAHGFARFGALGAALIFLLCGIVFVLPNPALQNIDTAGLAASAGGDLTANIPNWPILLLIFCVPLLLGFVCTLLFVRETKGKTIDQLAQEATSTSNDSGSTRFNIMMVLVLLLVIACIALSLFVPNIYSASSEVTPVVAALVSATLLFPFVYFFVCAGSRALNDRRIERDVA